MCGDQKLKHSQYASIWDFSLYCLLQKQNSMSWQTMDWDVISVCSGIQTHTCTEKIESEITNLFPPTHAHFPSSCQDASKQTLVYRHETTQMWFFKQRLWAFFFIHQHRAAWMVHCLKCMVFYWEVQKGRHCVPLSAKMQKDIDGEREKKRTKALLGILNNTVNQALRTT